MLLVICVGLSVDYAAHMVHGFLQPQPARPGLRSVVSVQQGVTNCYNICLSWESQQNARLESVLVRVGPAVLAGGLSTLLPTLLLAASRYYLFTVFFKLFFLVVLFGLFHGLILIPVLLSLVPQCHCSKKETETPEI